ncbi:hypothetical protein TNCV_3188171 [Trichonephila clavipes]|nr:hypothetical protein TNCV_3188171 [Trichonephila clavipes]
MSAGTGEYFPPLQFTCRNCGGGDRGRVAIYRPFGELRRAKIVLSPVWCSRPTTGVPLAHATMNFVGLDLTASDRLRGVTEVMAVCKCIVHLWHEDTLNRRQAASPLRRLVEEEDRWEVSDHPRLFSLKIGVEPSKIVLLPVWCSKLGILTGVKI